MAARCHLCQRDGETVPARRAAVQCSPLTPTLAALFGRLVTDDTVTYDDLCLAIGAKSHQSIRQTVSVLRRSLPRGVCLVNITKTGYHLHVT